MKGSQYENATTCMIPTVRHPRKGETMGTRLLVAGLGAEWDELGEHKILTTVKLFCMIL